MQFEIEIHHGDVLQYTADILIIKQSPRSGGLDAMVRRRLDKAGNSVLRKDLDVGAYVVIPTVKAMELPYPQILAVGTVNIFALSYEEIRTLGRDMLASLHDAQLNVQHAVTTLHGVNTALALDEVEAFRSLLLGFADAEDAGLVPSTLKKLTIIEREEHRAALLKENLDKFLPAQSLTRQVTSEVTAAWHIEFTKPLANESTPHVFVAMPFADEFDDQYYLAIRPAVTDQQILCVRLDQAESAFTGDIMEQVKERIRTAQLVIALLDGGNPNVYLEVGYAWGVGTPTLLILHEDETAPFDVQGARLLKYKRIHKLKEQLTQELSVLF